MASKTNPKFELVIFLCLFLKIQYFSLGADTISVDDVLSGNSTIVSASKVFEMGFFRPRSAPNYYLGIWYFQDHTRWAVWVANREKPVSLSSELRISNGNLVLFDESKAPIWSTNVSSSTTSGSVQALLLDTGNLVLSDSSTTSKTLWESFDYPSHTWLPGAKLGYNKKTNTSQRLTSWKNLEDPALGLFSCELDRKEITYFSYWNRTQKYWSSGSWDGRYFSNYPRLKFDYISDYNFFSNKNESYFTYSIKNNSARTSLFYMGVSGQITQANWLPTSGWNTYWLFPRSQCEVYALCGPYGSCSEKSSPSFCSCLTGFEPNSPRDWELKDYSGGCFRRTKLPCETNNSTLVNGSERDRFLAKHIMPLPENKHSVKTARSIAECESRCLNSCSCTAYSYDSIGCSIWTGDLLNLVQVGEVDGSLRTVYIRLAAPEFHEGSLQNQKLYILLSVVTAIAVFTCCFYYLRRKILAYREGKRRNIQLAILDDSERHISDCLIPSDSGQFREKEKKGIQVPFVALESILAATDNFSEANKLGQGGFGSVYKGKFLGGQEIAIKRLCSGSGQGLREFKNEILLIAKLQHRNLVRLLGYCVEGSEQLLLYEYMPNKSLDSFLFDQKLSTLLNWEIRINIILGIARGLLYLHHDSRLRVIHRDLKTSNVLLDDEMNPKISDFGLARIFGAKQTEASTKRVVGTYGYMSPEYAMKGLFSIKSDVFSFGVVTLEIISGKRNTESYGSEQALSLLGYAWKLWTENNALDLMDATLSENCNANEFLRCFNVGLLCVQEDPSDRPTMSNVVFMLGNETGSLPSPRQPGFSVNSSLSSRASSSKPSSNNGLTDTLYQGR